MKRILLCFSMSAFLLISCTEQHTAMMGSPAVEQSINVQAGDGQSASPTPTVTPTATPDPSSSPISDPISSFVPEPSSSVAPSPNPDSGGNSHGNSKDHGKSGENHPPADDSGDKSPGMSGAPGAPGDGNDASSPQGKEDLAQCADYLGKEPNLIKVSGNKPELVVTAGESTMVRVSGNQAKVSLKVKSATGLPLGAICVFVSGNQAQVSIEVDTEIKAFFYRGRGNLSRGMVNVIEGGKIGDPFNVDLAGNQASFKVSGKGVFNCPKSQEHGHSPSLSCVKE